MFLQSRLCELLLFVLYHERQFVMHNHTCMWQTNIIIKLLISSICMTITHQQNDSPNHMHEANQHWTTLKYVEALTEKEVLMICKHWSIFKHVGQRCCQAMSSSNSFHTHKPTLIKNKYYTTKWTVREKHIFTKSYHNKYILFIWMLSLISSLYCTR